MDDVIIGGTVSSDFSEISIYEYKKDENSGSYMNDFKRGLDPPNQPERKICSIPKENKQSIEIKFAAYDYHWHYDH